MPRLASVLLRHKSWPKGIDILSEVVYNDLWGWRPQLTNKQWYMSLLGLHQVAWFVHNSQVHQIHC